MIIAAERTMGYSRLFSFTRAVAMALLLCLACALSFAQAALLPVPALTSRVTDTTKTLDAAAQASLTAKLAELEQQKGAQLAVLMVPTTGEETIEQYAIRAFEQWKLGRTKVDDGILFVVAKDDRRMRIEVGYGLEGAVPDLLAGRIIREQVTPLFKQGDFAGGVSAGVDSLITLVNGEDLPAPQAQASSTGDEGDGSVLGMLLPLAFMALVLPATFAALAVALFTYLMFQSLGLAIAGGIAAFFLSSVGRALGAGGRGSSARASRRGGVLGGIAGGLGSGGGFGGGGFGGGGFGGGGGSSGGGGASGGW